MQSACGFSALAETSQKPAQPSEVVQKDGVLQGCVKSVGERMYICCPMEKHFPWFWIMWCPHSPPSCKAITSPLPCHQPHVAVPGPSTHPHPLFSPANSSMGIRAAYVRGFCPHHPSRHGGWPYPMSLPQLPFSPGLLTQAATGPLLFTPPVTIYSVLCLPVQSPELYLFQRFTTAITTTLPVPSQSSDLNPHSLPRIPSSSTRVQTRPHRSPRQSSTPVETW